MNIVKAGGMFQVYGENVETYKDLPVGSYDVDFSKMIGFFLTARNDLTVTETRIYGSNAARVTKVLKSYGLATRNFGVLLSGQKGIGKSLFVRMLAQQAIHDGLPVIVVTEAIPGIADFLSSIEQNCVVVFDEFEKTFAKVDNWNPQDDMLTLFDGIDGGHKLFVVTCNDLSKINTYMLNRPGRFHYHFTLGAPSQDEVREYLTDAVDPQYASAINDIVNLAGTIDMPYDYLRAIAFELNQGYPLKEVMSDLNITRTDKLHFDLKVYFRDGTIYYAWNERIDLSDSYHPHYAIIHTTSKTGVLSDMHINFWPSMAKMIGDEYVVNERIEQPVYDEYDFDELPEEQRAAAVKAANDNKIERIVLTKCPELSVGRFLV